MRPLGRGQGHDHRRRGGAFYRKGTRAERERERERERVFSLVFLCFFFLSFFPWDTNCALPQRIVTAGGVERVMRYLDERGPLKGDLPSLQSAVASTSVENSLESGGVEHECLGFGGSSVCAEKSQTFARVHV